MDYLIVALTALAASSLTFFSGFGLGTILMPVLACFFPVSTAIAVTAIVHFLNNIFKFFLTGRSANKRILLRFGLPAVSAAAIGANLLFRLAAHPVLIGYHFAGHPITVELVKLVMAILIIFFAAAEFAPFFRRIFLLRSLFWGGLLSGFFGGLSGHQGAFRSAVLIRYHLSKESFIATNVVLACMVDLVRLTVYGSHFSSIEPNIHAPLLMIATGFACLGSWLGNRFLQKVTMGIVRYVVAGCLFLIATSMCLGLI